MLFDLRSRGRRRTVQVVYLGLALLFAVGFVGFGVGGGFGGGGVFEGLFGKEGSSKSSFAGQIEAAEKRARSHPGDAEAWAKLADVKFHEASGSEFFNEATGKFTEKGKALLNEVASYWNRAMALKPAKPNVRVAQEMLNIYGKEALNQPASAVQLLQQVVIPAKPPSAALYGNLAVFAYESNNARVGDLASKKALSLSPANERTQLKEELERIKRNPSGNPENETLTATSKSGQPYQVKLGKGGKATAVPLSKKTATTNKK
jgi:hypothetical protein